MRVRLDAIDTSGRSRADMGDLHSLIRSIRRDTLLHPPIVRDHLGQLHLVSGLRRLEAIRKMGLDEVPVIVVRTLDEALHFMKLESELHAWPLSTVERVQMSVQLERLNADDPNRGHFKPARIRIASTSGLGETSYSLVAAMVKTVERGADDDEGAEIVEFIKDQLTRIDSGEIGVNAAHRETMKRRRAPASVPKPRDPGDPRAVRKAEVMAEVQRLHKLNWKSGKIAEHLGVNRGTVRNYMLELGIETSRSGPQRTNSTEIVERVATALSGLTMALAQVDVDDLNVDPEEARRWQTDLRKFRAALSPIYKRVTAIKEGKT